MFGHFAETRRKDHRRGTVHSGTDLIEQEVAGAHSASYLTNHII